MYPKQMNGPILSAYKEAFDAEFQDAEEIQKYLYNLSIQSAQETELENIGRMIGYVRPVVPEGFNQENIMLLGTLPIAIDETIGLSTIGSQIGGVLSTITSSDTGYMALGTYRQFLSSMAKLKRYGITLASVDSIVAQVSNDYTIEWDENNDIWVHFNQDIGYKNIWVLTQLFYRIATIPQVLISSGGGLNE